MGLSSGPWPKKEDWLKKKDRNQRRPGRRRSQEEGGGACELPPRAGPAAAKHLKLQQQLSFLQHSAERHRQQQHLARGRAWRAVVISTIVVTMISTIGGHADKRQPSEGELLQRAPLFHLRLSSVLGTATSLTDQLTDTSTPTLTSRQLQRLPNNPEDAKA